MSKANIHGKEARTALLNGAGKTAVVVGSSMGPMGRNTVIDHTPGHPSFPTTTRDGVTIARNFYLEGFEDTGNRMVREAGHRAVQDAGDGTTAAIVLAAELYKEGFAALEAGKNAPSSMVWRGNRQITAL